MYCPAPNCPWRGRRKDALNMHISNSKGKCGSKPKSPEKECMIYDANLIIRWIREDSVSIEIAEMFALNFVKEKAKELGKENLWTNPSRYDGATITNSISDDRRHFGQRFVRRTGHLTAIPEMTPPMSALPPTFIFLVPSPGTNLKQLFPSNSNIVRSPLGLVRWHLPVSHGCLRHPPPQTK
jgi:hypothetical protein